MSKCKQITSDGISKFIKQKHDLIRFIIYNVQLKSRI